MTAADPDETDPHEPAAGGRNLNRRIVAVSAAVKRVLDRNLREKRRRTQQLMKGVKRKNLNDEQVIECERE